MKPIIAVDFDGALLRSRPFDEAHKNWFYLMSVLLKDDSINEYAGLENYFDKVHEVMERYLGNVEHEARVRFARNLYAMVTVAEAKKDDLVADFEKYLRSIKGKYRLALITTAPESSVEPILEKVGCSDLFDVLYKSPMGRHPNKRELFEEFIAEYEKPVFYIGNGDKDITACKELGIKSISVSWVSESKIKGDFDIATVKELEEIL
ncbi:HAD hydrolase-like protein [Candidatus Woesearchaeota archaeon]|nr:HAD hydrolase-like protein [Candidatus Woesearchaeota archaeon]